jgi:hypothetical protein
MDRKEARESGKPVRVPLGQQKLKLQLSEADYQDLVRRGWVTRWVNDDGGRINQALGGGWKFAEPDECMSLGQSTVHKDATVGSQVRQVVSKGEKVMYAYLMKIQKRFYDEDQATKFASINELERSLIQGNAGGAAVEQSYLPPGVKQAVTMR